MFGRELPRARPSSRFTSLDYLRGGPGWTRNPACTLYEVLEGPLEILVVHDKSSMSIAWTIQVTVNRSPGIAILQGYGSTIPEAEQAINTYATQAFKELFPDDA